jgi:hypothetical protein
VGTPRITVGDALCADATVVSTTKITCTKPAGIVGEHRPVVEILGYGYVAYEPAVTTKITYALTVSAVTPTEGSLDGGNVLTITGTGFPVSVAGWAGNSVKIGTSVCNVLTSSGTQVTCETAPVTDGTDNMTVEVSG